VELALTCSRTALTIGPFFARPTRLQDVAQRPVLAVKIDNTSTARPQEGIEHADVVIAHPIEAATRLTLHC
jgi:hypothetical protein